jgi:endonuclease/exonuclease/phosphatase family protein
MEFNIEYGGTEVDFDSVPKAIEAAGADVVAIEEGYAQMPRIARALGWDYYDNRTQIVSKFPLLAPDNGEALTYVEVVPGGVVAMANVHLPSAHYGPFNVRKGKSVDEVVAIENRLRVPAVQPAVDALTPLASAGVPVFLIGDFNTPSHLDWTKAAIRGQADKKYPVDWPVSELVREAGFRDSYRELYPDPVKNPGLTWPANRPFVAGYNPYRHGDTPDRIDFIYNGGPSQALESKIVGEPGIDGVDIVVSPWPTDHRGEVTSFEVTPAIPPVMVSVDRRLIGTDEPAVARFHAPGAQGEHVVAVAAGEDPAASSVVDVPAGGADGAVELAPANGWSAGAYEAALLDGSGQTLATAPFWVADPGQDPVIATTEPAYKVGDPIEITWNFAPGNRWDWIAVYHRHADPNVASYGQWLYTGATIAGSATIDEDSEGPWPITPGKYSIYLMEDDNYVKLGGSDFTVG